MDNNLKTHNYKVTKAERTTSNDHHAFLVLFTGLSGAGKSSLETCEKEILKTYTKKLGLAK